MKPGKSKSSTRIVGAERRDSLAKLRPYFDALVARMQTSENAAAVDALFEATGAEIGAVAAAQAKESVRFQANARQKSATTRDLLDQLVKSTARACAAIDDTVAYVKTSNRKIARIEKKKVMPRNPPIDERELTTRSESSRAAAVGEHKNQYTP